MVKLFKMKNCLEEDEMKQSIKIILSIAIVLGIYYIWNQYEMYQISKELNEVSFVDSRDLTKVTVAKYPSNDSSVSYNMDEVKELYRLLETMPTESVRKGKETTSNYQIKFSDQALMKSITYTIYDNDIVKREQDVTAVMTSGYLKLKEPFDRTLLEEWIKKYE